MLVAQAPSFLGVWRSHDVHVLRSTDDTPGIYREAADENVHAHRAFRVLAKSLQANRRRLRGGVLRPASFIGTRYFAGEAVLREEDTNSFGVESAGKWQVRGNGNLALTEPSCSSPRTRSRSG